jgi:hypothetical protein
MESQAGPGGGASSRTAEHWINERRTTWERRLDRLGDYLAAESREREQERKK